MENPRKITIFFPFLHIKYFLSIVSDFPCCYSLKKSQILRKWRLYLENIHYFPKNDYFFGLSMLLFLQMAQISSKWRLFLETVYYFRKRKYFFEFSMLPCSRNGTNLERMDTIRGKYLLLYSVKKISLQL
jgi:hypothetical protein